MMGKVAKTKELISTNKMIEILRTPRNWIRIASIVSKTA